MALKKTESITLRTDKQLKAALTIIAAEKKWSISQLSEEIIREWLAEKRPDLLSNSPGRKSGAVLLRDAHRHGGTQRLPPGGKLARR